MPIMLLLLIKFNIAYTCEYEYTVQPVQCQSSCFVFKLLATSDKFISDYWQLL